MSAQKIENKLKKEKQKLSNGNKCIKTSVGDLEYTFVFHKRPNIIHDGTVSINAQIEINLKCNPKTHFDALKKEVSKEKSENYATLSFFYYLYIILRREIKLNEENRNILKASKNLAVHVQWLDNKPEEQSFHNVSFIAIVMSRANLKTASLYLLKHYGFEAKEYLQCMRASIRNGNPKLLSTIIENQTTDMAWENYFPFIMEESVNGEIRSDDISCSEYFSNVMPNPSRLRDDLSQNQNYISDSPLSYALRKGRNSKIIDVLLKHGAHPILERYGHRIDVSKELSEYQEELRSRKLAFLMGFNARCAQDSAIFKQFLKSEISHPKELARVVFDFL